MSVARIRYGQPDRSTSRREMGLKPSARRELFARSWFQPENRHKIYVGDARPEFELELTFERFSSVGLSFFAKRTICLSEVDLVGRLPLHALRRLNGLRFLERNGSDLRHWFEL